MEFYARYRGYTYNFLHFHNRHPLQYTRVIHCVAPKSCLKTDLRILYLLNFVTDHMLGHIY